MNSIDFTYKLVAAVAAFGLVLSASVLFLGDADGIRDSAE
jgi:hypothetical protein